MLIDFHTHTFPDKIAASAIAELSERSGVKPCTDGTMQGLKDSMARAGVDVSVVLPVATKPSQVERINRKNLEINKQFNGRGIVCFGAMHPDCKNYKEELAWLKDNGFRGIKLHPDYQKHYVDDADNVKIIAEAERLGLYTTIHAGVDIGYPSPVHAAPAQTRHMLDIVHPTHVILAHTGGWKQWDDVIALLDDPALYLDLSFSFGVITDEQFLKILEQHGSEQLLFATDSPWDSPEHTLEALKKLPLTREQLDNICYKNACRLLDLTY
jgi:hypothetical protein